MSKRAKVADLPEFDGARYLDSESSIAAYLTEIIEANDAALMTSALRDIARARGDDRDWEVGGDLYKALRPGSAPGFDWGSIRSAGCARRSG